MRTMKQFQDIGKALYAVSFYICIDKLKIIGKQYGIIFPVK